MNSSRGIPIVADVPREDPSLGFQEYAAALASAILGGSPPQFTIGIYGSWGSGKSSLLNAISNELTRRGRAIPVHFDAWRYERTGHIVVPLLHQVYIESLKYGNRKLTVSVKEALKSVVYSLKFNIAGVELEAQKVWQSKREFGLTVLDDAFSKPFQEMRRIPGALEDYRIVVLIDDLDRCIPDNVVAVLESINLVMDVPGFVFVLALDYDVLVNAVAVKYPHVSGHAFIEKMIQVPFRVPRLDLSANTFLEDLIPNWEDCQRHLPTDFAPYAHEVASLGLDSNPRQIKRMVNTFLVLRWILDQHSIEVNYSFVTALIGLQLRWPHQYQALVTAVFAGNPDPYGTLQNDSDRAVEHYAKKFFDDDSAHPDKLKLILQLTAAVAPQQRAAVGREAGGGMVRCAECDTVNAGSTNFCVACGAWLGAHDYPEDNVYRSSRRRSTS